MATDKQLDDFFVAMVLDRQPQGGLVVSVRDAQKVRSRQRIDQRQGGSVGDQSLELLHMVLRERRG